MIKFTIANQREVSDEMTVYVWHADKCQSGRIIKAERRTELDPWVYTLSGFQYPLKADADKVYASFEEACETETARIARQLAEHKNKHSR